MGSSAGNSARLHPSRMRERLAASFLFVPGLLVAVSIGMSVFMAWLDSVLTRTGRLSGIPLDFDAARSILQVISNSMLSLTALVFSITILVLQLASSQFSPRALRTFIDDRTSKFTLGVFLGTFAFAITGLTAVERTPAGEQVAPRLVVLVSFLMVLASIVMFLVYVNHVAHKVQVSSIIASIADETSELIDRLYPEPFTADRSPAPTPPGPSYVVLRAPKSGVIMSYDGQGLIQSARKNNCVIEALHSTGDFVAEGAPLLVAYGADEDISKVDASGEVMLGKERSMEQDVAYGLRRLVDIALKSLSPGINDPSTASQVLDRLYGLMRRLGQRDFPTGREFDEDERLRLIQPTMKWEHYVALCFKEIVHYGSDAPQIAERLPILYADLAEAVPDHRADALRAASKGEFAKLRERRSAVWPV